VTLRALSGALPPCDQNETIYVDGSSTPSVEWQGMEDSFGFSWNFPPEANRFPYSGYNPFFGGYAAYRFFLNDRIPFRKSLRMAVVGTGPAGGIGEGYTKPGSELEFSSVAYWYQKEPHQPFAPILSARDRLPFEPAPSPEKLAADRKHVEAGEALVLKCGGTSEIEFPKPGWAASHGYESHPGYVIPHPQMTSEIEYLKPGWDFRLVEGQPVNDSIARVEGWPSGTWRSIGGLLEVQLLCPKRASGTLKLFLSDGEKAGTWAPQEKAPFLPNSHLRFDVTVAGRLVGEYANFGKGKWVEAPVSAADTAEGVIPITIKRAAGPDAALSEIVFVESK
jgi:hypothetical protein